MGVLDFIESENTVLPDGSLNVSGSTMEKAIIESSVTYNGNITVDEISAFLEQRASGGYDLKNILKRLFLNVYAEESPEYEQKHKLIVSNMKAENLEFFRTKIFIDGIGADGNPIKTSEPEPDPVPEYEQQDPPVSDFDFKPDNYDDDNNNYYDSDENNSYDFSDDSLSIDDFRSILNDETSELESNDISDDNYEEQNDFSPSVIPENPDEAQIYYNNIKDKITSADVDSDITGIYFESEMKNEIISDIDVNSNNNIKVTINLNDEDDVCTDFCIIVSSSGKAVLLGSLIYKKGISDPYPKYYVEAKALNIDFDSIKNADGSFELIWTNQNKNHFYSGEINLRVKSVEKSKKTLCVDFGSSNTTAGIYTADSNICTVKFQDVTNSEHTDSNLCPTLVYVKNIISKNDRNEAQEVEFLFGYDAKKILIENSFTPRGTMFSEIKRWIINPYEYVEISDGKTEAVIQRAFIIKAYLNYILRCSENHFKCHFTSLHFSAPVKLKSHFIYFLKDYVFREEDGYHVMNAEESIDEGVAIVYNYISKNIINTEKEIQKKPDEDDSEKEENIIIIDCGGGTTDLVNCNYSYKKTPSGYNLTLRTTFENGNSNFGGNNITYRIFQLLKIKLSDYYMSVLNPSNKIVVDGIDQLINANQNEIFNDIDICIKNGKRMTIYDKLDEKSQICEKILPTDFNSNVNYTGKKTYPQVMRNFYLLWQLAEEVKIEFFSKTDCAYINLNTNSDVIRISPKEQFFYIKNPKGDLPPLVSTKSGGFEKLPKIEINTNEITTLIRPDIYYLLATIFNFEQSDYDWIKLSGQSCKINLFLDLLKEFVPGRKLRTKSSINNSEKNYSDGKYSGSSERLKMKCIEGCIAYIRDKELHIVNPDNPQVSQMINNNVYISRSSNGETFTTALFKGNAFKNKNNSEPLHVEQYNATQGTMYIYVTDSANPGKCIKNTNPIEISINCDVIGENAVNLEYDYLGGISLRERLMTTSYYGIEEYNIPNESTENEISLIDDLINQLKSVDVRDDKKVLVFAVPNREGYGFILYQIIKTFEDDTEKYYLSYQRSIPFESGAMTKSFFNGNNNALKKESGGVKDAFGL